MDYYLLAANEELKMSFEAAVKAVFAAQVEGGLEPQDVTLQLSPGSVIIDAWFANSQNLPVLRKANIRKALCHKNNLNDELLGAVSSLPQIQEVTTRELHFDKAPQCANQVRSGARAQRRKRHQPARKVQPSNLSDTSACDPPCLEGRGICGDKVCFCHHPWGGIQCERDVRNDVGGRISWKYVSVAMFFVACVGALLGECIWKHLKELHKLNHKGLLAEHVSPPKSEFWSTKQPEDHEKYDGTEEEVRVRPGGWRDAEG